MPRPSKTGEHRCIPASGMHPVISESQKGPTLWGVGPAQPNESLDVLQIRGGKLAALAHHIEAELLPLIEAAHPGALDCGDVDEHVLPAIVRLDESKALLRIEKLHSTLSHIWPPLKTPIGANCHTTIAQHESEFSIVLGEPLNGQIARQAKPRTM